jgi:hypothetical protein
LAWCAEHGRVICTRNQTHFRREHQRRRDRGEAHPGILLVSRDWSQEEICLALRRYLEADPDPALLVDQVVELPPADSEGSPVK